MHRSLLFVVLIALLLPLPSLRAEEGGTKEKPAPDAAAPDGETPAAAAPEKKREIKPFKDVEKAFHARLKDKDPEVRMRAFQLLASSDDVRAVDLIVKSLAKIRGQQDQIRKAQRGIEDEYEKQFNKKLKADTWFKNSMQSGKDLDRYNKGVRKISKRLDKLRMQQKALENDFTRTRAMLDDAVRAMMAVLENLGSEDLESGLDRVQAGWLESRVKEDRIRWVDSLVDLDRPAVEPRLVAVVDDGNRDMKIRAAALEALADRKASHAHHKALFFIENTKNWDLILASIEALRRLHEKRSIPPLMQMLGDEALLKQQKRLREDLHQALKSLTGLGHGPYAEPWQKWWEREGGAFQLPEKPVAGGDDGQKKAGITFYGIHTFSDRILFILDISGSMAKSPTKKDEQGRVVPTGPPNIETAREELKGAINNLNEGDRFNVIFFNHEVVLWAPKMVAASESTKRRAIKWFMSQEPVATTNIYDAFEKGFAIALQATGEPIVDTIFFMTDGRPTSGKIQDPKEILQEVLEWNRSANCRIHTVGIGDHERELLEQLAKKTGGTYVNRGGAGAGEEKPAK